MSLYAIQRVRKLKRIRDQALVRKTQRGFLRQLGQGTPAANDNSILDLQIRVSPGFKRASHFAAYAELLQRAVGDGLRVVFSAPPQHGKTEVTLHGLVWLIINHPGKRHAYITYSQTRARSVARKVRRILRAAGIDVGGNLDEFVLPQGGACIFTSIDGGITGNPVDGVAIIDDPYKNRSEADSSRRREVVEESYRDAIETRVHPGASVFLLATRWHPNDLSGVLIGEGWQYINLPALAEPSPEEPDPNGRREGEALFPEMWPVEELLKKKSKVLGFTWAALYQGRPRPKGGLVFHEPTYYRALPRTYRGAFGVDLAYSSKTKADWSICLELWREDRGRGLDPLFYVIKVDRKQSEAPEFAAILGNRHKAHPTWGMLWRASGTEKGAASFIQRLGIPLVVRNPPGDKLVSATEVAIAWNDGRILVPDQDVFPDAAVWLGDFLAVVSGFTGNGKERDDDVDGLGNAYELLRPSSDDGGRVITIKSTREF